MRGSAVRTAGLLLGTLWAILGPAGRLDADLDPINDVQFRLSSAQGISRRHLGRFSPLDELVARGWLDGKGFEPGKGSEPGKHRSGYWLRVGPSLVSGRWEDGWHAYVWPHHVALRGPWVPATLLLQEHIPPGTPPGADEAWDSLDVEHVGYLGSATGPEPGDGLVDAEGRPIRGLWGGDVPQPSPIEGLIYYGPPPQTPETVAFYEACATRARRSFVLASLAGSTVGLALAIWAPPILVPVGAVLALLVPLFLAGPPLAAAALGAFLAPAALARALRRRRRGLAAILAILLILVATSLFTHVHPAHQDHTRAQAIQALLAPPEAP